MITALQIKMRERYQQAVDAYELTLPATLSDTEKEAALLKYLDHIVAIDLAKVGEDQLAKISTTVEPITHVAAHTVDQSKAQLELERVRAAMQSA